MNEQTVLLEQLETRLLILQDKFKQQAGGKTVCEIGREGQQEYSLKKAEGRMQAMTDIVRCLKKARMQTPQHCLADVAEQWQKLSEVSRPWLVYKQAGLEEIDEVMRFLNM